MKKEAGLWIDHREAVIVIAADSELLNHLTEKRGQSMKRTLFAAIAVILTVLFVAFLPQETQQQGTAQNQQTQVMELMKDSAMVKVMMDQIAANSHLRIMMMQKMIHHAKADSTGKMAMCKMMTDDKEMQASLTKLLHEQKQDSPSAAEEIIIKFNSEVKDVQVSALESEAGLKQIKVIPELNLRIFQITSSKSADEVIAICEKKPFVEYAEPNYKFKALKN